MSLGSAKRVLGARVQGPEASPRGHPAVSQLTPPPPHAQSRSGSSLPCPALWVSGLLAEPGSPGALGSLFSQGPVRITFSLLLLAPVAVRKADTVIHTPLHTCSPSPTICLPQPPLQTPSSGPLPSSRFPHSLNPSEHFPYLLTLTEASYTSKAPSGEFISASYPTPLRLMQWGRVLPTRGHCSPCPSRRSALSPWNINFAFLLTPH